MLRFVRLLFIPTAFLFAQVLEAQQPWSLEQCIRYAVDNNITVKQAAAQVRTAQLSESQAKAARLPGVNANANLGEQFGRTIDPTTNQFNNSGIGYNSLSLNANLALFTGGQINHSIKQAQWEALAAQADADYTTNTLALQVAQAYLQILLFDEQLASANRRVDLSKRQLESTLKLINAGNIPLADRFNVDAQIARDEQSQVQMQNNLDLAYLNLKHLLNLEPDFDLKIERPSSQIPADANPDAFTMSTLYNAALSTQHNVKAAGFRVKGAEEGIGLARSSYYPSLSLFASLSSNYSTQYKDAIATGVLLPGAPTQVDVNGMPVTVVFYQPEYRIQDVKYFDQLDRNFGQGVGLGLNIPIYSNGRTRLSVERARLNVLNAQMQETQTTQQLKNDIQTAIANARAAKLQLEAAQRSYQAAQTAYNNTERRHQLGTVNTLELGTAKTNMDIAENELITAKYDYIFRLKILDFYQGRPITLK